MVGLRRITPSIPLTPNPFSGYLTCLAVYPKVLMDLYSDGRYNKRCANLYNALVPTLLHQWTFDNTLADSAPWTARSPNWPLTARSHTAAFDRNDWIDPPASVALGGSQVLDIADAGASSTFEDFSLTFWFKPDASVGSEASTNAGQILFDAGDDQNGFALRLRDGMLESRHDGPVAGPQHQAAFGRYDNSGSVAPGLAGQR